ncbi:zinc finger CCCH domain-containing protein 15-like [Gastrolobium bilobum]|uniref:zinc finger CCCH domain-containing protein 15-like n=1 Tax=Gastrolobium bilobum TaxID=150636 RepID=UPI002AAF5D29|nr:zinc finger CCCH domain-containing protein 15-like [Gastrolobium bilobum]
MHNKENCSPSSNGGFGATATCQMQSNGGVFDSLYSSLFSDDPSPSSATCNNGGGVSLHPYEVLKYTTDSGIQKHQDMVNRHSMCLSRLVETSRELEGLRKENLQLRDLNLVLQKRLSLFMLENRFGNTTPFDLAQGFGGLDIGKENMYADWNNINENKEQEVLEDSPTSVIENNGVEVERFSLPKSISVRSNGYLKMMSQCMGAGVGAGASNGSRTKGTTRSRISSTTPPDVVQKVHVRGGNKEEEPLEMVVYNQGMFKTELCNKWQQTGTCPYGDHCQFSHGIGELRPVIRHPRYKTEVCRMVLAGVVCPYGHRCHFRHALTEEEKAIAESKPR